MNRWAAFWIGFICICLIALATACAAPQQPGIYSQIAIIKLPIPDKDCP